MPHQLNHNHMGRYHENIANDEIYDNGDIVGSMLDDADRSRVVEFLNDDHEKVTEDERELIDMADRLHIEASDLPELNAMEKKYIFIEERLNEIHDLFDNISHEDENDKIFDLAYEGMKLIKSVERKYTEVKPEENGKKCPKEIGHLYADQEVIVMCTGSGTAMRNFSGVVVEVLDPKRGHKVGHYASIWPNNKFFKHHESAVILTNVFPKPKTSL
jgi:hypothetical protein